MRSFTDSLHRISGMRSKGRVGSGGTLSDGDDVRVAVSLLLVEIVSSVSNGEETASS